MSKKSIYKLKARKFEPETRVSAGERLRKLFSSGYLSQKSGSVAESLGFFLIGAVMNTCLLGIGIIAPGCWIVKILSGLGATAFDPQIYHILIYTAYCFPLGVGLALFKFPHRHGWFIILTAAFFASGLLAPVVIGALCKLIIQLALSWILDVETVMIVSSTVYLLLTAAGLINAVHITVKASEGTDWNDSSRDHSAAQTVGRKSDVSHPDIFDASESDSDGGDGGD